MRELVARIGVALAAVRPGSLANKVALLLCVIIVVAFSMIFLYVVPQLQSNLEEQTLAELTRSAGASSGELEQLMGSDVTVGRLDEEVRQTADEADARVTLLGVQRSGDAPGGFYVISDSRVGSDIDVSYGVANESIAADRVTAGIGRDATRPAAQAAAPLRTRSGPPEWVALYTRSLDQVTEAVGLIRRQLILAGLLALVVCLTGGYLVARALARRVGRLEAAARDVAARRKVDPLPIDSEDELGQLTRTFNEMQEQLARVDRARRDFIANASHELRTPIFSLAGFAELLQDEELDSHTRAQFLRQMREQVERLQKLAVELLDLSRLDAGSLEFHLEDVNIAELARGVVAEFEPALSRHRTELEVRLPSQELTAHCDPQRVSQIMRILLDNALRHTPAGTHVTVSAARQDGVAEFTVQDAGQGLDAAAAERVFERFYTADAARGSGLGLAIAKELAERMRGRISIRSTSGDTRFTLALPAGADGLTPPQR
jgi:signal transduction histidine kinase